MTDGLLINPYRFATAGFNPLTLPGIVLWLDASNSGSITSSGGAVSQWSDLSGAGNHVTQGTAGAKPTTGTTSQNGLNTIDFDGGDGLVSGFSIDLATSRALTLYAVYKPDISTGDQCIIGFERTGTFDYQTGPLFEYRATGRRSFHIPKGTGDVYVGKYFTATSTSWHQRTATLDGPGGTFTEHWDGASQSLSEEYNIGSMTIATYLTAGSGSHRVMVGSRSAAASDATLDNFLDGQIAELIACTAVHDSTNRGNTETYLKSKWGTP